MKKENGFIEIAGLAIITILVLSVGLYIYNSSAKAIDDATKEMQNVDLGYNKNKVDY